MREKPSFLFYTDATTLMHYLCASNLLLVNLGSVFYFLYGICSETTSFKNVRTSDTSCIFIYTIVQVQVSEIFILLFSIDQK